MDVPELGNLFLAGDWIGPEGFLVDASMASARDAARAVIGGRMENQGAPGAGTTDKLGPTRLGSEAVSPVSVLSHERVQW